MQTIGPYQLVQALGECPVGGVWSAVDADNNQATVALLSAAAAREPGWRNAFAATANSLAQTGEVPLIAGDYSGPTPWIAAAARDVAVLGRVFNALGMDLQAPPSGESPAEPAKWPASGEPTESAATSSPPAAANHGEPESGAPQPVSGAPSEPTPSASSASPYQSAAGSSYGPSSGGGSPYTVSPFSVPPAGPPRRTKAPLFGLLALVLVVLLGGVGVLAFVLWPDDDDRQVQPTAGPSTAPPPLPGLAGQWDFDEGSGVVATDSSGKGNDASFVDGADWTTDGYGGTPAVEYADAPGHLLTDGPVVLSNQSFTASAWVRLSQEADHPQYVLWQPGEELSAFVLQYLTNGLWAFSVTSNDGGEITWHELTSTSSPALGEWTHLAGVYDREQGEIRIYVNGRSEASLEVTVQPSVSGLQIGNSGTGRFYGTIDSVRAYQAALTDDEVADLYQEQQGGA